MSLGYESWYITEHQRHIGDYVDAHRFLKAIQQRKPSSLPHLLGHLGRRVLPLSVLQQRDRISGSQRESF